jgi:hypothetical protein
MGLLGRLLVAEEVLRFRLRLLLVPMMVICGGTLLTANFTCITTMGQALSGLRRLARL